MYVIPPDVPTSKRSPTAARSNPDHQSSVKTHDHFSLPQSRPIATVIAILAFEQAYRHFKKLMPFMDPRGDKGLPFPVGGPSSPER